MPLNARRQGGRKSSTARKPLEVGSSGLVCFSESDNVTDGLLSLPAAQPQVVGRSSLRKACSACPENPASKGFAAVRAGDSVWMRSSAPWCGAASLFALSGKLLAGGPGVDGSGFPPKPGWTIPGAEVWEGAAVCISQETDQGGAQEHLGRWRHTSA